MSSKEEPAPRALVVGPVIHDHYHIGVAAVMDQAHPVPAVKVTQSVSGPGGAFNAVNHLSHMALPVSFVSAVGIVEADQAFMQKAPPFCNIARYVAVDAKFQTAHKHRVYVQTRMVSRHDFDPRQQEDVSVQVIEQFNKAVAELPPTVILLSDYNKGVCTPAVITAVCNWARQADVPVVVDPSPVHTEEYSGVHLLLPNMHEARVMTNESAVMKVPAALAAELLADRCVMTCGEAGMFSYSKGGDTVSVPAVPANAIDGCGCGDAVAAAFTYSLAIGMDPTVAANFAATAGAIAAEHVGCQPVSLRHIFVRLAKHAGGEAKLVDTEMAQMLRASVFVEGSIFGVANGVFDLLHPGHVSMLEEAKQNCGFLLVLLNSDESATRIKRTPIQPVAMRASMLATLPCVDGVLVFDGDTPAPEIALLQPHMMFKGPGFKDKPVPGAELLSEWGGVLHTTASAVEISTTSEIARAKETDDPVKEDPAPPAADDSSSRAADAAGGASV